MNEPAKNDICYLASFDVEAIGYIFMVQLGSLGLFQERKGLAFSP